MTKICFWSVAETASRLRRREVSVVELTRAHIAQIEAVNPAINAITTPVAEALDVARSLDDAGMPDDAGPLWGVPVTTKINVDQQGYANSNGIADYAQAVADADSPVVANLKAGGAVIVGRTNTPEFSMRWCTSNALHGVSLNPWDRAITPGGSSGAAAAAVASGIGAVAHGNDLGGSLRYPAFCCGVATIRPSMGRIPAMNPTQSAAGVERGPITQMMSVQGPIARSMADVRAGLTVMAARDSRDPAWVPAADGGRPRRDRPVIGVATNPFPAPIDPAVEKAIEIATRGLRDAGYEIREVTPPHATELAPLWGALMFTETMHLARDQMAAHGSDSMKTYIEAFAAQFELLDAAGLLRALQRRIVFQRAWSRMFDEIDLLLMPPSLMRPFANDLDFNDPDALPGIVQAQAPLMAVNVLGLPAIALPTHREGRTPLGVQLVAPIFDDLLALQVGERLEAELGTLLPDLAMLHGTAP